MSSAGIYSNRGDNYQIMIALEWALIIFSDPDFLWLETDSISYLVDDVVIGKKDGSVICCQCKKNQPDFRVWTLRNLEGELRKAFLTLVRHQDAKVHFYSRNDFGELAKLREYSRLYSNETDYLANLPSENKSIDTKLESLISIQDINLSTYEFLCRVSFETTRDFEHLEILIQERLRKLVSNSRAAYDALFANLIKLGGRIENGKHTSSSKDRLTKEDIQEIFREAGAIQVPMESITSVRKLFESTSSIGRSWHREISGHRISSPIVDELMAAVDAKKRAVLLTGIPGSGKTCTMLNFQEALEQRMQTQNDLVPLFIQSREFAELATVKERHEQGLPEKWVEQAARLADDTYVVVVIDSLDVLSIAREHRVLTYFLAQIDRLLTIPNVTVVTACRDFDRKYDRRIATRKWDCELKCPQLNWTNEIVPLLNKLGIDWTTIDEVTQELISNPRELDLFVELAMRQGSFNVVTSQAIAKSYLDTIVRADPELGDIAMREIETIAENMLRSRSLSIPHQLSSASQVVKRRLFSLNVLQETHDGKLTFGHQTLLDVLVISGAIRQGVSLNDFIQSLPPVPFVRPSIRSFVAQLAMGDRREFRKQLRTVLTSNAAFNIRRLVAESFAQQVPLVEDWPLIRDLRKHHREVFQVIYTQTSSLEWHHFWFSHLVPLLKEMRDSEGLLIHVNHVTEWLNDDAERVLVFWMDALSLDWLESNKIAERLTFSLSKIQTENLHLFVPLLKQLLGMPKPEDNLLGHVVARCVVEGVLDDQYLWDYIVGDIKEDNIVKLHYRKVLNCQPDEFGSGEDNFLSQRMIQSTTLLNLALNSVEEWSKVNYQGSRKGYRHGFLGDTSYSDVHSQSDHLLVDGERILLGAIESAIVDHSQKHSEWWQSNRERICFNPEGALCYFGINALVKSPHDNIELIGRLLCERSLLEFELSYEIGALIREAFIYLDSSVQDDVMLTIENLWQEEIKDGEVPLFVLRNRAEYISVIPCHLRTVNAQSIFDDYENSHGILIRQPSITSSGGGVTAPFSYEVFLNLSDNGVVSLLAHYAGYQRDFDNFFIGGEREVGWVLREASSRHPLRFLRLLVLHGIGISAFFKDEIMDGIASHLAYRYGNLQKNSSWVPIEEPDGSDLVNLILDELERNPAHWEFNHAAAKALQACAHVLQDKQNAARFVSLAKDFVNLREESTISGDSTDLITTGINMITGTIAEALMIMANNFQENEIEFPEQLAPTLNQFATYEHPAIRALILYRLPYLQGKNPELGWELFNCALQDESAGLWNHAERCLYYSYHERSEMVARLFDRIRSEGNKNDMETWGRISALSALSKHIDFQKLLEDLNSLNVAEAWKGAASVWSHPGNIRQFREQCFLGIETMLKAGTLHSSTIVQFMDKIFEEITPPISVPLNLIQLCFDALESNKEDRQNRIFGFDKWLNVTSQRDPELALVATEIYLPYVTRNRPYFYDHENQFVQIMTRLFAEAEEKEESDSGAMLMRVVAVQDLLLSLGVSSIDEWLKAAERQ